jgi:hypothetical protein
MLGNFGKGLTGEPIIIHRPLTLIPFACSLGLTHLMRDLFTETWRVVVTTRSKCTPFTYRLTGVAATSRGEPT